MLIEQGGHQVFGPEEELVKRMLNGFVRDSYRIDDTNYTVVWYRTEKAARADRRAVELTGERDEGVWAARAVLDPRPRGTRLYVRFIEKDVRDSPEVDYLMELNYGSGPGKEYYGDVLPLLESGNELTS